MLTSRGAEKIGPESTGKDATVSTEVCAVTATAPGVIAPIVSPRIVTENREGSIVAPEVFNTTDVAVVALQVIKRPVRLLELMETVGVIEGAKKLGG
jgi:hypothetical protein